MNELDNYDEGFDAGWMNAWRAMLRYVVRKLGADAKDELLACVAEIEMWESEPDFIIENGGTNDTD